MIDINLVADYIIVKAKKDADVPLNTLKLQKLLYYIQAWYLVHYNEPMFDEEFQAWIHGPVNRKIFDRFKTNKFIYSEINEEDIIVKNPIKKLKKKKKKKELIDSVLDVYMKYSGSQLEALSHSEKPWKEARNGYSHSARCEKPIKSKTIKKYYSSLLE